MDKMYFSIKLLWQLFVSYQKDLSLCFNGHFPGGHELACTRMFPFWILLQLRVMEVVSGNNWSYKMCKTTVKMSPPTNQHPVSFTGRTPFLSPNQNRQSSEWKAIKENKHQKFVEVIGKAKWTNHSNLISAVSSPETCGWFSPTRDEVCSGLSDPSCQQWRFFRGRSTWQGYTLSYQAPALPRSTTTNNSFIFWQHHGQTAPCGLRGWKNRPARFLVVKGN